MRVFRSGEIRERAGTFILHTARPFCARQANSCALKCLSFKICFVGK